MTEAENLPVEQPSAKERLPLSVCCLTHVGPAQTRAALSGLSDIAAEVVLGVDARCASQAAAYEAFADRVIVFPAAIVEHRLAALHAPAHSPWTLRIDSDEVASPGLLEALPGLLADDRIAQYWIARRWLVQDGDAWLDEAPWWPDYQVRLVRTAEATFSGGLHSSADAVTPRGLVLEPLYHADCVLTSWPSGSRRSSVIQCPADLRSERHGRADVRAGAIRAT